MASEDLGDGRSNFRLFLRALDELRAEQSALRAEIQVLRQDIAGLHELGHLIILALEEAAKRGASQPNLVDLIQRLRAAWTAATGAAAGGDPRRRS